MNSMEVLGLIAAGALLLWICSSDNKKPPEKKYRKDDLVFGRDHAGNYCVYCCSENFKKVFEGTASECEDFISNATYM